MGLKKGSYVMFIYDISKEKNTKKVRFVYALKGRGDDPGIVQHYKGIFIAPACFVVPPQFESKLIEVFKGWKIRFKKHRVEVLD